MPVYLFSTIANAEFSDSNWPKTLPKASFLSKIINVQDGNSNLESITRSKAKLEINEKPDVLSKLFFIEANKEQEQWNKDKQSS